MNNLIYLENDEKIHLCTKQGLFINMLHRNNTCGAEFNNHDSLLNGLIEKKYQQGQKKRTYVALHWKFRP